MQAHETEDMMTQDPKTRVTKVQDAQAHDEPGILMRLAVCSRKNFAAVSTIAHIVWPGERRPGEKTLTCSCIHRVPVERVMHGRAVAGLEHFEYALDMGMRELMRELERNGAAGQGQLSIRSSWQPYVKHARAILQAKPQSLQRERAVWSMERAVKMRDQFGLTATVTREETPPVTERLEAFGEHPSFPSIVGFRTLAQYRARNPELVFSRPERLPRSALPGVRRLRQDMESRPFPEDALPVDISVEPVIRDDADMFERHVLGLKGDDIRRSRASQTRQLNESAGRRTREEILEDREKRRQAWQNDREALHRAQEEELSARWGL